VFCLLLFKGLQKTTLIDFPGKVASTFFLPKCNFRCGFCYNPQLVFDKKTGVEIKESEAIAFLEERQGFLDGVCITGGEPLLHKGLLSFLKKVQKLGLLTKLDTNGSLPVELRILLDEKAVDFVSMDIKASLEKYDKVAGTKVNSKAIEKSVKLIRDSGIDYEFRMTAVPEFHVENDLIKVGNWLKGSKTFVLQQFNSSLKLLDSSLEGSRQYNKKELKKFAEKLAPFFEEVKLRGL